MRTWHGVVFLVSLFFMANIALADEMVILAIGNPGVGIASFDQKSKALIVRNQENPKIIETSIPWGEYPFCWWKIRGELKNQTVYWDYAIHGGASVNFVNPMILKLIFHKCDGG